jgi:hypothetical protein
MFRLFLAYCLLKVCRVSLYNDRQRAGLGEGGEIEVQMLNLAQMLIRIPMFNFSTRTHFCQTHVTSRASSVCG